MKNYSFNSFDREDGPFSILKFETGTDAWYCGSRNGTAAPEEFASDIGGIRMDTLWESDITDGADGAQPGGLRRNWGKQKVKS